MPCRTTEVLWQGEVEAGGVSEAITSLWRGAVVGAAEATGENAARERNAVRVMRSANPAEGRRNTREPLKAHRVFLSS